MRCILALLFTCAAFAQSLPILPGPGANPPLLELKQFLELTDAQYAQLFQNIALHQRNMSSYQQRIFELQRDIAIETAREQPSATELGTRYVEVELNCRIMNDEAAKLRTRNQTLLTAAQKTKLQVLLDAIKLLPIINQAQQASLLDFAISTGGIIPSALLIPVGAGGAIAAISPTSCRTGSFNFIGPLSTERQTH